MRPNKFLYILLAAILSGIFISVKAQIKVTDGAVLTMDANSLLELESTNKGLLIPRMAINNINQAAPLTAPVPAGMLVYSTGGSVSDGFYFWNGTQWNNIALSLPVQVSNGGTGLTSGTSGGIPAYTGTTTITSSPLLIQNALVIGGGAGATPTALTIGSAYQVLAVNSGATGYTHRAIKQQIGTWTYKDLKINLTNVHLLFPVVGGADMLTTGSRTRMAFDGRIIGLTVSGSAARAAGTATFTVFRNNAATTVTAAINATNTQFAYSNTGTVAFVAGDLLDIRVTTNGTFTEGNNYAAWIIIEWTN